jgi:tryptophanyl-tRNA synthetase
MAFSFKKNDERAIMLSGIKPTGRPHIGNYFGMMKQLVDLQGDYKTYAMIADYHALNSIQNGNEMRSLITDLVIDYLAIGLDPKKVILFKQSDVSTHTELCWIFDSIVTMPYLMRAHAYKDAEAKNKEINVGTFNYPVLMAADILLYNTDIVPVGSDQKQHVEYARDIAEKFNHIFGETFKLPKERILESVKTVPGTDGRKMSKSYGNTIPLFATDEEIKKAVMGIPTDSKGVQDPKDPATCKVFALHELVGTKEELEALKARYTQGGIGYKESKDILVERMKRFIAPLRLRRAEIANKKSVITELLAKGAKEAKTISESKMVEVRKKIGVTL